MRNKILHYGGLIHLRHKKNSWSYVPSWSRC